MDKARLEASIDHLTTARDELKGNSLNSYKIYYKNIYIYIILFIKKIPYYCKCFENFKRITKVNVFKNKKKYF